MHDTFVKILVRPPCTVQQECKLRVREEGAEVERHKNTSHNKSENLADVYQGFSQMTKEPIV